MFIPTNGVESEEVVISTIILLVYLLLYSIIFYMEYISNNEVSLDKKQLKLTKIVLYIAEKYDHMVTRFILIPLVGLALLFVIAQLLSIFISPMDGNDQISKISLLVVFGGILINILQKYLILDFAISRIKNYIKRIPLEE